MTWHASKMQPPARRHLSVPSLPRGTVSHYRSHSDAPAKTSASAAHATQSAPQQRTLQSFRRPSQDQRPGSARYATSASATHSAVIPTAIRPAPQQRTPAVIPTAQLAEPLRLSNAMSVSMPTPHPKHPATRRALQLGCCLLFYPVYVPIRPIIIHLPPAAVPLCNDMIC